jgi:hypothetical protein
MGNTDLGFRADRFGIIDGKFLKPPVLITVLPEERSGQRFEWSYF